eukprot:CAMPEP_0172662778 /NCGR_PEP_ID=MMETSP1074-20121228/5543_1 /TAXON_ID=2916 /ORGANISM="Ceratium fusus, Strain PA161109" /LENGTH=545 /DNA_ID=CAMNT_0013478713 /DNA_START=55 /DNA_END=1692 /DNA_ORIENTATION=+
MQLPGTVLTATAFLLHFTVSSAITVAAPSKNFGYGPSNCVSVERSTTGSCVVHTNCRGLDLSQYDFKFDCVEGPTTRQTHSLGVGSFDEAEDFDTDVQCQQCLPPQQHDHGPTAKPATQGGAKKGDMKVASGATQKKVLKTKAGVQPPRRVATLLSHSTGRQALVPKQPHQQPRPGAASKPLIQDSNTAQRVASARRSSKKTVTSVLQLLSVASPAPAAAAYPYGAPAGAAPAWGPANQPHAQPAGQPAAGQPAAGQPAAGQPNPSIPRAGTPLTPGQASPSPPPGVPAVAATTTSAPWPDDPSEVYGPGMCISTWRNRTTGTCVLQTQCAPHTDMSNYDFGFLCTRADGNMTRHLYGNEFFELHATFVSDIQCARCRALEEKPMDSVSSVTSLVTQVSELQKEMVNISSAIIRLKQRAMRKASVPAPGPPAGMPPPNVMVQARSIVTEGSNSDPGVVVAASEEGLSQATAESTSSDREQDAGEVEMASEEEEEDAAGGAVPQEAVGDVVSSEEVSGDAVEQASSEADVEGAADDEAQYGDNDDS